MANATYAFAKDNVPSGVHVVRNPFALLSSAYHSHLRTHPIKDWPELVAQRRLLEGAPKDVGVMLTIAFIERADFYAGAVGPFAALRSWDYSDARFQTMRMEDVVRDATATVGAALHARFGDALALPDPREFKFERFSNKRPPGQVDALSHYRSGDPDQWRAELPEQALAYVKSQLRDLLERQYPDVLRSL